ncbi:MAG: alanine racemase [Chthoniobacterales bacterium]
MNGTESLRCWVEIDTDALRHNAEVARARVGPAVALLAVIKANGYGHGLARVAEALASTVQLFGVANLQEALEARAVVRQPILILGPALAAERETIARNGFIPSVSSFEEAAEFSRSARGSTVALNVVIDTGMGRIGVHDSAAVPTIEKIVALRSIEIHSISTHLPSADEDAKFTEAQLARFASLVERMQRAVPGSYRVHALPSAGVLAFPEHSHELVRAGLMLYGISSLPEYQQSLRPAMTLKTRVVLLRDLPAGASISYGRTFVAPRPMRVATLSVGYADGYPRALSNRGAAVLLRGLRSAVLGRITMDLMLVDASAIPGLAVGEEAVLIGRQGEGEILASELAQRAGTIPWEIFTGIGSRVERVYH